MRFEPRVFLAFSPPLFFLRVEPRSLPIKRGISRDQRWSGLAKPHFEIAVTYVRIGTSVQWALDHTGQARLCNRQMDCFGDGGEEVADRSVHSGWRKANQPSTQRAMTPKSHAQDKPYLHFLARADILSPILRET